MDKWTNPLSHQWSEDELTVRYEEGVAFVVRTPERRRPGHLYADTVAKIGETVVNRARIDWLDQRQRVDFHAVASMRDGRVPWQALMVPIIELLEAAPDEPETELSPTGKTPIATNLPVEPFPIDVFPKPLARLVKEASAALPCPPEYVAVPMLHVLASAIGTVRVVEVKANWHEGPRLFGAVVGDPGTKKSPAMKLAMKPLFRRQEADEHTYNDAKAFYEAEMKRHEVDMEVWRKEAKAGKSAPMPPNAPDMPTMGRSWTSNSTSEALALLLKENPRGLLLYQDELTAWARGMDQYRNGRGADRQFWLSLWNGAPVAVDRKSQRGPLLIHNPCCNVVGGLPPDVLSDLSDERGRQDGFIHRVLFSYPDDVRITWTDAVVTEAAEDGYDAVVQRLLSLKSFDFDTPQVLSMTPKAHTLFVEFANELYDQLADPDLPACLRGPWLKMEGICARLALILQLSRWAAGETELENIEPTSVIGAVALIKYFQSHAKRAYSSLSCTPTDKKVEQAIAWIQSHGGTTSAREVQMHRVAGVKSATEAKALLRDLEDRGFGRVAEGRRGTIQFIFSAVNTQQ
jgi:Protein of unknown function (DUF3987)